MRIGDFDLLARLGRGGHAEVWRATHAPSGTPAAIKVLRGPLASDERYRAAFRNEVRSVAALDHRAIVVVYEHGTIGPEEATEELGVDTPWLAMELALGGTVRPLCGRAPWSKVRRVLLSVLDALAHAHARGVIHRDIKPSNVLLLADGTSVKLADFGIAHPIDLSVGGLLEEAIAGTPSFMAPEQIEGAWRDYGPATDLYALGGLAWALVTGTPPFGRLTMTAAEAAHLTRPLPALEPRTTVPSGLEGWLAVLLDKDPAARFACAADAAAALVALDETGEHLGDASSDEPLAPLVTLRTIVERPDGTVTKTRRRPQPPPARRARQSGAPRPASSAPPIPEHWALGGEPEDARPQGLRPGAELFGMRAVPMTGREAERTLLWSELREAADAREVRAVVLSGPSGYGKSRLAEWLGERAHEVGAAHVLRALHGPSGDVLEGLGAMIARHLRALGLDRHRCALRVDAALRRWGAVEPYETLALTELIVRGDDASGETARVRFSKPAERFAVIERHLVRVASDRAVVVVLDDVHWGIDALEFASWMLGRQLDVPILVVLTARDEALPERPYAAAILTQIGEHPRARHLAVGPLSPSAHARLVSELLPLHPELGARLGERTAGNPLFAIQLAGEWLERGLLEPSREGLRLRAGAASTLPATIGAVWRERISALLEGRSDAHRDALELAAVLGQEVSDLEWEEACREAGLADPAPVLEALLARRLAKRDEAGVRAWSFVHGMLRETVVEMALQGGRLALHHQNCARALERWDGAELRRAGHLLAANQRDLAVEAYFRGARQAIWSGSHAAAAGALETLRAVLQEEPPLDTRRVRYAIEEATLTLMKNETKRAARLGARAAELADEAGWAPGRLEARLVSCRAHQIRGELRVAEPIARSVAELAIEVGDLRRLARARTLLARILVLRGQLDRALELLTLAEPVLRDGEWYPESLVVLLQRGDIERIRGDHSASIPRLAAAVDEVAAQGRATDLVSAANACGDAHRAARDLEGAQRYYEQAANVYGALGMKMPSVELNRALISLALERPDEAREIIRRSLSSLEEAGVGIMGAVAQAILAAAAAADGEWTVAEHCVAVASERLDASGIKDPDAADAFEALGSQALRRGNRDLAVRAFQLAIAQWRSVGRDDQVARLEAMRDGVPDQPRKLSGSSS